MHTNDDDRPVYDALDDAQMKEIAAVLDDSGYPGGIKAFAAEAREAIASCVGGAVWKDLELEDAEGLTDAEALAGIEDHFSEFGEPGYRLDGFIEEIWAKPARQLLH
jgi:hypothetical protein